jgi:hypothetical protein
MMHTLKKPAAVVLMCALFVSFTLPIQSAQAQVAAVTIEGPGPLLTAALASAAADTTGAAAEVEQSVIKKILDGIAWAVAKTAIQSLTKSMVNWINSGFNGSPAFVTDLKDNLGNLQDAIADDFFDSLADSTGIDVRSPFQEQITDHLRQSYYRSTGSEGFFSRNNYDALQEQDAQKFLKGDFQRGGWDAWMRTVLNDNNNPIGALYKAEDELFNRIESARVTRLNELSWGGGLLSWRGECIQYEGGNDTLTSTSFSQDASGNITSTQKQMAVSLNGKEKCIKNEIRTPGSVIQDQLSHTLGSGVRQLELADSINEIVGALVGQLVNQVLGGGGLASVSRPSQGGGDPYIDRASDDSQYDNTNFSLADGFVTAIETEVSRLETLKADWEEVQRLQDGVELACGGQSRDLVNTEQRTVVSETIVDINEALAKTQAVLTDAQGAGNDASGQVANISSAYQNLLATNPQTDGAISLYRQQLQNALSCSS